MDASITEIEQLSSFQTLKFDLSHAGGDKMKKGVHSI